MAKKKTIEECISSSKEKFGESTYDYTDFIKEGYVGNKISVPLICNIHNHSFRVTMNDHLGKKLSGCPICGLSKRTGRTSTRTYDVLCQQVLDKFGEGVLSIIEDETITLYTDNTKVDVVCLVNSDHGISSKSVRDLTRPDRRSGCSKCATETRRTSKDVLKELVEKAKIHFKNKYDYSSVDVQKLTALSDKVSILCPVHGVFAQSFDRHFQELRECRRCAVTLATEDIYSKLSEIALEHIDVTDIQVQFKEDSLLIKDAIISNILCKKHNVCFSKTYNAFTKSFQGCHECISENLHESTVSTKEEFVRKATLLHGDKFDYSKVDYYNSQTNVEIICKFHNRPFFQQPNSHLQSKICCPICVTRVSSVEVEISDYIKSITDITVTPSYRPKWLEGKELDLYIPSKNFAIEYNGTAFHHSSNTEFVKPFFLNTCKDSKYHFNKWKTCFDNDTTLLSIYDFYWNVPKKQEIYKSKIRHYLGLDRKIYARKTKIVEISNEIAYQFYEDNHIEGKGFTYKSSRSFALMLDDEVIMCSTIGEMYNQSSSTWKMKLHRICTLLDTSVVGGLSKLTKFLINMFGDFSYQITLSSGGATLKNFTDYSVISPRYFWVDPFTLKYYHRNYCQKSVLEKHFGFPVLKEDTESSYMEKLGYLKVFDNGLATLNIN